MTKETSAKPPLSDVEQAHAEYLSHLHGAWRHDKRKKQQTAHVEPDDTPEEALSDGVFEENIKTLSKLPTPEELAAMNEEQLEDAQVAAYQDALTYAQTAWRIPTEDARRLKRLR